MNEQQLWQAVCAGDEGAFRRLYDIHYPAMVGWAAHLLQDQDTARDLAQDIFVALWQRRHELTFSHSVKSYLMRAVRNRCLNQLNKARHLHLDALSAPPQTAYGAQEELQAADLEGKIQRALKAMPTGCRTVLLLRRVEQLSVKEIATEMGISPKTVENQLTKALKWMASALAYQVLLLLFVGNILVDAIGDCLHDFVIR